jgi:hypothetical protein
MIRTLRLPAAFEARLRAAVLGRPGAPTKLVEAKPEDDAAKLRIAALAQHDFDAEMAVAGGFAGWLAGRRSATRQFTEAALADLASLLASCPGEAQRAIAIADRVARAEFSFLGSGPFAPVDTSRPVRGSGHRPIDWFSDPIRKLRFPANVPCREWKLLEMRPGNADIKYPWELSRCQHFLALAQAYLLTNKDGYGRALADQALDFIEANPIGIGINWTCTMDVALRAANWCLALPLAARCLAVGTAEWEAIYRHLFETGRFIVANLENHYEVTSNHFLSNIVGLHILAAELGDLPAGRDWDAFARESVEREIEVQVLPDGADYESSVPYHRLVTELFLGSWRLAQMQQRPLSAGYRDRLHQMVDFHEAVLRPDGRMPAIGDADDGRLMIATGCGVADPGRGVHILAPAGLALERPALVAEGLRLEGEASRWESFWWGFPAHACDAGAARAEPRRAAPARLFPDAGIAVSGSRAAGAYLVVTNAIVGTNGFGNHKHNDLLSFEYHDQGVALVVDPGSYVYTSDFDARNTFRGTARHNTLMLDGVEQNELRPEWLFRMFAKATPRHVLFDVLPDGMVYEGSHDGYETRLDQGVAHSRRFRHRPGEGCLAITDSLVGAGRHDAVWHFHLDPAVAARLDPVGRCLSLTAGSLCWQLAWSDAELEAALVPSAVSPSYGVLRETRALRLSRTVQLDSAYEVAFDLVRRDAPL